MYREINDLIEIKGVGKKSGIKATFLKVECSENFITKVKNDYGLDVEYNEKILTIYFNEDRTHLEMEYISKIHNENIFLIKQKHNDGFLYSMCPYWFIDTNYEIEK